MNLSTLPLRYLKLYEETAAKLNGTIRPELVEATALSSLAEIVTSDAKGAAWDADYCDDHRRTPGYRAEALRLAELAMALIEESNKRLAMVTTEIAA